MVDIAKRYQSLLVSGEEVGPPEYNALYKWKFVFAKRSEDVMARVDEIIDLIHPILQEKYG